MRRPSLLLRGSAVQSRHIPTTSETPGRVLTDVSGPFRPYFGGLAETTQEYTANEHREDQGDRVEYVNSGVVLGPPFAPSP